MQIEINDSFKRILNLPRSAKTLIAIILDFVCLVISVWFSYYLRLGDIMSLSERGLVALIVSVILSFPIFIFFGLYKAIFRFSGFSALAVVLKAILVYGCLYTSIISILGINGIPRTIGIIQPLILFILISSWRMFIRYWLGGIYTRHWKKTKKSKALVYGSGNSARQLVKAMQDSLEIVIVGFIDDDINQQGCFIDGKKIYSPEKLHKLIIDKDINLILLALPNISNLQRKKIIKKLRMYKIAVRTIPKISDLAKGKRSITDIEELEINDLLGRIEVEPFTSLMNKNIYQKVVLVTGAGGSIGSELCKQIVKLKPKKILLLEISEYALYSIHLNLENINNDLDIEIIPLIGSIQDKRRISEIIKIWKPTTIYHAAAYKHVPIVEHNLIEGLKNNVFGTLQLSKIAIQNNVSNFVFISTDKAVRPTNIMGVTKRLGELILQALNNDISKSNKKKNNTKFSIVRFGNVIGSSGSVIPKFKKQINNGGPITLTHKEITRYFMSLTEAAQLVIQAGAIAKGGDVFVLDMGEPIKIYDLAKNMIEFSGLSIKNIFNINGDIEILVTGLRPGEKLYEELLLSNKPTKTKHPKIFRSKEPFIELKELENELNLLKDLIRENKVKIIFERLQKIVTEYSPKDKIVDHTFTNKND